MGNCVANRKRFVTHFQRHQKTTLEFAFKKAALFTPESRKEDRLYIANFQELFRDNPKFGEQLHWFMEAFQQEEVKGVHYDTFLQISMEVFILGRTDNPPLSTVNRVMLVMLVVVSYGTLNLQDLLSSLSDYELTYLQIYDILQTFLRMLSQKRKFNEAPVKAFVDGILNSNFMAFFRGLLQVMPSLDAVVESYFCSKFMEAEALKVATLQNPSYLLNLEWVSLLQLAVFNKESARVNLLYSSNVSERDFTQVAAILTSNAFQTLILLQCEENYALGACTNFEWVDNAQPQGSKDDCLFQMLPVFRVFRGKTDKFMRPQYAFLNSKNEDFPLGLGFGGELGKDFRVFIGKDLETVQIRSHDKTYESGDLLPKHMLRSRLQVIEIWSIQVSTGTTQMKDLILHQQEENVEVEEFTGPQIHLDEDISSYRSGEHQSLEDFNQQDEAKWDEESNHGFEEEILIKQDGFEEIQKKNRPTFETIALQSEEQKPILSPRVDQFQEEHVETGVMQASTFEKQYVVQSGKFGDWNGESSDWNGNGSASKSNAKNSNRVQLSKDLATITEELKESTNTQY